jgi:hypothetical protein
MPDIRPSRRTLLRLTAAGAVASGFATATTTTAYADEIDYTARRTFDDWDRLFQQGGPGQPDQPNDNSNRDGRSGMLAWSQSYVLLGLVRMYERYRDTYYLDRLVDNVDQVLAVRDSERGVQDYRGLSLPAWRADHPYTTGYATLADSNERSLLDLRQALPYAEDTTVKALAQMLTGQLAVDEGDAYRWHYWPTGGRIHDGFTKTGDPETDVSVFTPSGGPARQFEDISHGALDVEFAVRAFRARLAFTGRDMARLARTFTRNVATADADGLPAVNTTVAGGTVGAASVAHQAPRWMQVAPWDPQVHAHNLALYNRYRPSPERDGRQAIGFGWLLANTAYLNWASR